MPAVKASTLPRVVKSCAQALIECAREHDASSIKLHVDNILYKLMWMVLTLVRTFRSYTEEQKEIVFDITMDNILVSFSRFPEMRVAFTETPAQPLTIVQSNTRFLCKIINFSVNGVFSGCVLQEFDEKGHRDCATNLFDVKEKLKALFDLIRLDDQKNHFDYLEFFLSKWFFEMSVEMGFSEQKQKATSQSPFKKSMQSNFDRFREYRTVYFFTEKEAGDDQQERKKIAIQAGKAVLSSFERKTATPCAAGIK